MNHSSTANRQPLTLSANILYGIGSIAFGVHQSHLLVYMAAMLMTVRVLLSLYEIPGLALGPELTLDYDQRTSLMSSRFFFATLGGAAMSVLALQVFLRKDATHPLGLLYRAGYREKALSAGIAIFFSIVISSVGTHRFVNGDPLNDKTFALSVYFHDPDDNVIEFCACLPAYAQLGRDHKPAGRSATAAGEAHPKPNLEALENR